MPPLATLKRTWLRGTLGLLLSAALAGPAGAQVTETPRPRLGLALGGGAARGIAHIGILEWLEEHRIPVDRIAGTSMGGLIGGGYAAGMSTDELRALMRDMDWDLAFLSDSPFKYKDLRRKTDARRFPSQFEIGLKSGVQLPTGVNPGQQIELALDRITAPYIGLDSFDDLPIPFRAAAVDLRTQEAVVLSSGSLARALRATMSLPGLFTPVVIDDQVLLDGGLLDNVPVDIARDMGADAVIAVNVGSSTDGLDEPRTLFDVLSQAVDVMMLVGIRSGLALADVVVTPDLRGLSGTDWRRSDEMADVGYAAAEAMSDALLPYAVDEAAYERWQSDRLARRRPLPDVIDTVRVDGVSTGVSRTVMARLGSMAGAPLDIEAVEENVLRLTGSDRFALVRYQLEQTATGTALVVTAEPKDYGPPFFHPAVDLTNTDANHLAMNLRGRFVFLDVISPGAEARLDASIGTGAQVAAEFYQPVGSSRLFVAPRAYWKRDSRNIFDADRNYLAEYRERTAGVGGDIGVNLSSRSDIRLGYDAASVRVRRRIGLPILPEGRGANRYWSVRWRFDGQTSPIIPTRGVYARASFTRYQESPDLFLGDEVRPGPANVNQAEGHVSIFHSLSGDHRLFAAASGGTSFGRNSGFNDFELGGLLRLGAYSPGVRTGDEYALVDAGVLFRVLRLPDLVGGNGYAGAWLEAGSVAAEGRDRQTDWQGSGGLVLETFVGPVFVGGSVSFHNRAGRFYVHVGPLFD